MKKLTVFSAALLCLFFSEAFPQGFNMPKDKFYIGFFNEPQNQLLSNSTLRGYFTDLSANTIQWYGNGAETGDPSEGGFFDAVSTYKSNVETRMQYWETESGLNSMLYAREKVRRPCYGQTSRYQLEYTTANLGTVKPGYLYENTSGSVYAETWQGETVNGRKSGTAGSAGYWMAYNLYENREQVNRPGGGHLHSDTKDFGGAYTDYRWYVKPRMRIDSVFAKNNPNLPVVALITKNFMGVTLDSVVITCRQFLVFTGGNFFYDGSYKELFDFPGSPTIYPLSVIAADLADGATTDYRGFCDNVAGSQVDYKIYWYGEVEVWIDYVKVEDEWAHFLLNDPLDNKPGNDWQFHTKIQEEVEEISTLPGFGYFYIDEYEYNHLECIAAVESLVKQYNNNTGLINITCEECTIGGDWSGLKNPPSAAELYQKFTELNINRDVITADPYPIRSNVKAAHNLTLPNTGTYPGTAGYTLASDAAAYTASLHAELNSYIGRVSGASAWAKANGKIFSLAPQIFTQEKIETCTDPNTGIFREPSNEEIRVQSYISLAYGAKQLMYFTYTTPPVQTSTNCGGNIYYWGMLNTANNGKRVNNYFGQDKWAELTALNIKVKDIGEYIHEDEKLKFDTARNVNSAGLPFEYVTDIKSIYRDNTSPFDYNPVNEDAVKYWELGFFTPDATLGPYDKSRYILAVNKRCTPDFAHDGDERQLKVKFDGSQLAGFNNWKLTDAVTGSVLSTFDKNVTQYVFAGAYEPGEGRLLKLAPVMQDGGTLVTGELVTEPEFDCKGEVLNNGYDITIIPETRVNFTAAGKINMTGGDFRCGVTSIEYDPVQFRGKDNSAWDGITLTNCDTVDVFKTNITNIAGTSGANNFNYAFKTSNCPILKIKECSFTSSGSLTVGGLSGSLSYGIFSNPSNNIAVLNNTFDMGTSQQPAVNLICSGSISLPVLIDNNTFTSSGGMRDNAITLSNFTGGAIKNNTITGHNTGIRLIETSIDILNNTISSVSGITDAVGILGTSGTTMGMQFLTGYFLGGINRIYNYGTGAKNIEVDNSLFNIDEGYNTFDINASPTAEYHLSGTFPGSGGKIDARFNCFKLGGTADEPVYNVEWENTDPVTFDFEERVCVMSYEPDDYLIVDLGGEVYDTIDIGGGGEGASQVHKVDKVRKVHKDNASSPQTNPLSMTEKLYALNALNEPRSVLSGLSPGALPQGEAKNLSITEENPLDELYATACIEIRKRDYSLVEEACTEILESYPDSTEALDAVQKLYTASLMLDSAGSRMAPLKTFFEELILNNGENSALVSRAFYYIQKCKAALEDYQSALEGFQQIITQNPGTYEALVASWDYAATSLLMGSGGSSPSHVILNDLSPEALAQGEAKDPSVRELQITNYELRMENTSPQTSDGKQKWIASKRLSYTNEQMNHASTTLPASGTGSMTDNLYELEELDELYKLNGDPRDRYDETKFTKDDRKTMRINVVNAHKDVRTKNAEKQDNLKKRAEAGDRNAKCELETKRVITQEVRAYKPQDINEHIAIINRNIKEIFARNTGDTDNHKNNLIPETFALHQNYPNPFNPVTKISFDLPKDSKVSLTVYDILGRQMAKLINGVLKNAGKYTVDFNGSSLASGVYFYRIEITGTEKFVMTKRMVLVK